MKEILILLTLVAYSVGSPVGAPAAACLSMTPNHGVEAQTSESPYRLSVSETAVKGGEIIKVELLAQPENSFKGFLIQARTSGSEFQIVGEFLEDEDEATPFNFRDCASGTHNAVTHFSRDLKDKISFKWKAPENFEGSIQFV